MDGKGCKTTEDDYHKYMEQAEAGIGRYPKGFRHYENFTNYSMIFRDANIDEYQHDMNRQVELSEYLAITRENCQ